MSGDRPDASVHAARLPSVTPPSEEDYSHPLEVAGGGVPIYSRSHFVLSVAVGLAATLVAGVDPLTGVGWTLYAAVVGVGIDFDHFLVAWHNTGSPRAIRYVLSHPSAVLLDQGRIFQSDELTRLDRLLSHMLIGGPLVAGLRFVATDIAVLTAATLYVHLVADLVADVRATR